MEFNRGIVLHNYIPQKRKIAIFDRFLGRINAILDGQSSLRLTNGSLITYYLQKKECTELYRLQRIENIIVPFTLARHDIYFLHYILELCFYFLPVGSPAEHVFDLISYFLQATENNQRINKKIFLCQFFAYLCIYPESNLVETVFFQRLISEPIGVMLDEVLDDSLKVAIESWLRHCLDMHPNKDWFKTINKVNQDGMI